MSEIKFKRDTAFRKTFFVSDSFAHPAKMDAQLLIWIVERYSTVGEIILDPMAGSGTTMLACTLGRNVVMVELEGKFCKMMRNNWEMVKMRPQLGSTMGNCQIIQGDARQLEGLVDKVITSPPFAGNKGGLKSAENFAYGNDTGLGKRMMGGIKGGTGSHPDNIDSLPYGQIDKIVTSPPYTTDLKKDRAWMEKHYEGIGRNPKGYTVDQYDYNLEERNISNFPYGNIDSIITSPPYSNPRNTSEEYDDKYDLRRPKGVAWGRESFRGRYSGDQEDKTQIGNLKSQSYLEAMLQVYQNCYSVLKNGGLMILVTKNFIRNKQVVRLDTDTIRLCEQAGFSFVERHERVLPSQSFWRILYARKYPSVATIDCEDILVFRKEF